MSKDKSKRLEETERLETEITRSLSVAKMKEAHKHIEDIEKLRKQSSVKSICERISFCIEMSGGIIEAVLLAKKESPDEKFSGKIAGDGYLKKKYLDTIVAMYESIYFDFQRTIDVKKEDFDRLFPKIEFNLSTLESIIPNLNCLRMRLLDMKNYCLRSL